MPQVDTLLLADSGFEYPYSQSRKLEEPGGNIYKCLI
jgi:hypothetical protein